MKAQEAHFNDVAHEYDESIPEHVMAHLTARRVALAVSLVPAGRVLDVGCGTGRFLDSLPNGYERVGIDVSAAMLTEAEAKGLKVLQASGDKLPFADDSFDLVTTFAVLHHLIDRDLVVATLREIARVVRSGGAAVVWDHNPLNPYWRILMARLPQDQGDERLVPARLIVDTLRGEGMRDVRLRRLTFTPDFTPARALAVISRMERALEHVPLINFLAAHNVVTVRA
jgi:SAM-dependent methyltransferase